MHGLRAAVSDPSLLENAHQGSKMFRFELEGGSEKAQSSAQPIFGTLREAFGARHFTAASLAAENAALSAALADAKLQLALLRMIGSMMRLVLTIVFWFALAQKLWIFLKRRFRSELL